MLVFSVTQYAEPRKNNHLVLGMGSALGIAASLQQGSDAVNAYQRFTDRAAIRLTLRETEVLKLLAHGATYARAGDELGVSLHTVTTHVKNIYRKLEVHSAAAAVMRAVQLQLLLI